MGIPAACEKSRFGGRWATISAGTVTYEANPPFTTATTRSPGAKPSTPSPTALIVPEHSLPRGSGSVRRARVFKTSLKFKPVAAIWISTCPCFGSMRSAWMNFNSSSTPLPFETRRTGSASETVERARRDVRARRAARRFPKRKAT